MINIMKQSVCESSGRGGITPYLILILTDKHINTLETPNWTALTNGM